MNSPSRTDDEAMNESWNDSEANPKKFKIPLKKRAVDPKINEILAKTIKKMP